MILLRDEGHLDCAANVLRIPIESSVVKGLLEAPSWDSSMNPVKAYQYYNCDTSI